MHTDTGQIMCAIGHKQTSFHIEKSEDGDVHGSEDGSFIKKLKTLAFFTWHKTKLQCTMPPTSKCAVWHCLQALKRYLLCPVNFLR